MLQPSLKFSDCIVCGGNDFRHLFTKKGWHIEKCRQCGFVFVNPRYSETEAAAIYNEEGWFSGCSGDGEKNYAQEELASVQRAERIVAKIKSMRQGAGLSLFEIGCGLGYVLDAGRKAGFDVAGLDISAEAAAFCRQKGHHAKAGTISEAADETTKTYDIIAAFDVFEHICEPLAFLASLKRMAKPGTLVVLAVPNVQSLAAKIQGRRWGQFVLPEHLNYFGSATIRRVLENNGFVIEEIHSEPSITFGLRPALRRLGAGHAYGTAINAVVDAITRFKRYIFYPPINWAVRKAKLEANLLVVFARVQ
jgi:2-polyprenyl-3-methyl-5-hydroxy-6-metoxy-1,4-benzoquinol methylase